MPIAARPTNDLTDDLELLRTSAVAGGILAAGYFRKHMKTWTKENASPVSEADVMVDNYLRQSLLAARPSYGWLSEETADAPERLSRERVFIVDPIDGTRAFISGDDCWALSLAIVENGEAIAGVIYAPARDEMFCAAKGLGATYNGKPVPQPNEIAEEPLVCGASAVHTQLTRSGLPHIKAKYLPSLAYRLVQVAVGGLDVAVARRGAQDWDIAAAAVFLEQSGYALEDVCAGPPQYNREQTRHGALAVVANSSIKPLVHETLISVYGCPDTAGPSDQERQTHESG